MAVEVKKAEGFSEAEARKLVLRAIKDGDLPPEDRFELLVGLVQEQNGELIRLRLDVASLKAYVVAIPGFRICGPCWTAGYRGEEPCSHWPRTEVLASDLRVLKGAVPS